MNLDDIEKIVKILKQSDISEFELEQDGVKIKLSRTSGSRPQASGDIFVSSLQPAITTLPGIPTTENFPVSHSVPVGPQGEPGVKTNGVPVKSPIVGTFYRKPSPDAEVFVKEGSDVKKGDTLCIVEAMKLMNEIEAPCSGKIEKILSTEGSVVEYGEILFTIIPDA